MTETITCQSPERAWEPFLAWLRDHDIDPMNCYRIDLGDGEDPRCVAYLYARNRSGDRYILPGTDIVATLPPQSFVARRPAPRWSP